MKSLIFLLVCLFSFNTFASDDGFFEKIVCQQYDRESDQFMGKMIILNRLGEGKLVEDEDGYMITSIPYAITIRNSADYFDIVELDGTVLTEDVHFFFASEDESVNFKIYLDEMEHSQLRVNGKKEGTFYCN